MLYSHLITLHASTARHKDFKVHAALCDELLGHYSAQWADRQVYWKARDRSSIQKDLLTIIIDSFDRSKVSLPKWPLNRTPKRTVYELHLRSFTVNSCISRCSPFTVLT